MNCYQNFPTRPARYRKYVTKNPTSQIFLEFFFSNEMRNIQAVTRSFPDGSAAKIIPSQVELQTIQNLLYECEMDMHRYEHG